MYHQFQFELILHNGSVENAIGVGGVFKDVLAEFSSSFMNWPLRDVTGKMTRCHQT